MGFHCSKFFKLQAAVRGFPPDLAAAVHDALAELRADKTRLLRGPRLGGDWCLLAFGGKRTSEELACNHFAPEDDDEGGKSWIPPVVEVDREVRSIFPNLRDSDFNVLLAL